MKRVMTVVAACLLSQPAFAAIRTWDADSSRVFSTAANWSANTMPGGSDTALINSQPANGQPQHSASVTTSVNKITLTADTNSVSVSLEISAGTLSTSDVVLVKSDQDGASTATLDYTGGTFAPAALTFDGSALSSALGYFDLDCSVGSDNGALHILAGTTDIEIVQGKQLTVGDFTLDSGADFGMTAAAGTGTAVISCTSYTQSGLSNLGPNCRIVTR